MRYIRHFDLMSTSCLLVLFRISFLSRLGGGFFQEHIDLRMCI